MHEAADAHHEQQPGDSLFPVLFDILRAHGHRPGLHLVADRDGSGCRRAWLSAAGFGALGHSIDHACRLYVQAGVTLAKDPELRITLRRLADNDVVVR
jgi:hypothetical protein